eukprot:m.77632 g.77632  ORF g.77632 m.77632 type:complete len:141 (-) comp17302_c1_seq2:65-487(-)
MSSPMDSDEDDVDVDEDDDQDDNEEGSAREQWPDEVLRLGVREINSYIRQHRLTKEQGHDLKRARRRFLNRSYAKKARDKKTVKQLNLCVAAPDEALQTMHGPSIHALLRREVQRLRENLAEALERAAYWEKMAKQNRCT